MKIHGSGPPKRPSPNKSKAVDATTKSKEFSSVLSGSPKETSVMQSTSAAKATSSPGSVLPPGKVQEIAAQIRAGKVNRAQVTDIFVREVVEAQMGGAGKEKISEALVKRVREIVETDPFLSKQLDALMAQGEGV